MDSPLLISPAGKLFTWSFSALNDFETCPRQYAAKRFYCTVTDTDTEATIWGTRVHKALELRLKDGTPLTEEFAGYEKYCAAIMRSEGLLDAERQLGFNRNLKLVDWDAADVWGRSVLDVLLVRDNKAWIYDWKTGKMKENSFQLRLFAAVASLLYPEVTEFVTRFVWLKHDQVTGEDIKAEQIPFIWNMIHEKIRAVEMAWEYENFPCNPSGLCRGWCPVKECDNWRPKR